MTRRLRQRGAALLEFAVALPFTVMLFLGIGDFSVYFWRQTQMEDVARIAAGHITPKLAEFVTVDELTLAHDSGTLERIVRRDSGFPELTLAISRHYACPLSGGGEEKLSDQPQLCPGERVYLRIASDYAVSPLLQPLRWMGYPKSAFCRHYLRAR